MFIYGYLAYWIFSFVVGLQGNVITTPNFVFVFTIVNSELYLKIFIAGNTKLIPRIKDGVNAEGAELPYMVKRWIDA